MIKDINSYHKALKKEDRAICDLLNSLIAGVLKKGESKIWHGHPVWFLEGNPIVGYSTLKDSVRLLFWSGQSFEEDGLENQGSFKAADARYTKLTQVNSSEVQRWLKKSKEIQWDYKNIVKRKGKLERLV